VVAGGVDAAVCVVAGFHVVAVGNTAAAAAVAVGAAVCAVEDLDVDAACCAAAVAVGAAVYAVAGFGVGAADIGDAAAADAGVVDAAVCVAAGLGVGAAGNDDAAAAARTGTCCFQVQHGSCARHVHNRRRMPCAAGAVHSGWIEKRGVGRGEKSCC